MIVCFCSFSTAIICQLISEDFRSSTSPARRPASSIKWIIPRLRTPDLVLRAAAWISDEISSGSKTSGILKGAATFSIIPVAVTFRVRSVCASPSHQLILFERAPSVDKEYRGHVLAAEAGRKLRISRECACQLFRMGQVKGLQQGKFTYVSEKSFSGFGASLKRHRSPGTLKGNPANATILS